MICLKLITKIILVEPTSIDQQTYNNMWEIKRNKSTPCLSEKPERPEKADKGEKPIKLVLKVGSNQEKVTSKQESPSLASRPSINPDKTKSKDHSSKKKKKKRSSSRERKKPKFDPASTVSIQILCYNIVLENTSCLHCVLTSGGDNNALCKLLIYLTLLIINL